MLSPQSYPLPTELSHRAEVVFGDRFENCLVIEDDQLESIGCTALTNGRHIWVNPRIKSMAEDEVWHVFGHELAHMVQQRKGIVPRAANQQDTRLYYDPALEAEAEVLATYFVKGEPAPLQVEPGQQFGQNVYQPLVSVAGEPLKSFDQLPQSIQSITKFIDGGTRWLDWAIAENQSQFDFPDTVSLVTEIQAGLHGRGLLLISQLQMLIHPLALLSMPDLGIDAATNWLINDSQNSVVQLEGKNSFEKNGYLNQSQLSSVHRFLTQLGLGKRPVFQALGLGDQIAIYQAIAEPLGAWSLNPTFQKEAGDYAADYGVSARSFADYYRFYESLAKDPSFRNASASERANLARERSDATAKDLRNDLRCPLTVGIPDPLELQTQMQRWFSAGNALGFSRLSKGVVELNDHEQIARAELAALSQQIKTYLQQAQKIVQIGIPDPILVSQDGCFVFYSYNQNSSQAILKLERQTGCVTLETCSNVQTPVKANEQATQAVPASLNQNQNATQPAAGLV